MDKSLSVLKSMVFGLIAALCILFYSLSFYVGNLDFYMNEFDKLGIAEATGMSTETLEDVALCLIDYLTDEKDDVVVYGEVNGEHREIFNEREKLHMIDVKDIIMTTRKLMVLFAGLIMAYILVDMAKKKFPEGIIDIMVSQWLVSLVLALSLAVLMFVDFTSLFIKMHELLFTNDLWLLNPVTDIMIQLLPEKFFTDMAFAITKMYLLISTGIGLIGVALKMKFKRNVIK